MFKKKNKTNCCFIIGIVCVLLLGALLPISQATNVKYVEGFDSGPNYTNVVPIKKTTFVQFDKETILDDYSYLAAIPTAVFNYENRLFSYPLLFFEDEYEFKEDKEKTFNARQGIDYFMEDWMEVCYDKLDQMTLINVPKGKVNQWNAKEYISIEGDNPFDIASGIALNDWAYSDNAVIAVIEEDYARPSEVIEGSIREALPKYDVGTKHFDMERPSVGIGGNYEAFEITDKNYKYIVVEALWDDSGFEVDMQIYDDNLGLVTAKMDSCYQKGAREIGGAYIHNYDTWEIGLTAFPKKSASSEGIMKSMYQIPLLEKTGLFSKLRSDNVDVDVMLLPGIDVQIDTLPTFGCRDAKFTVEWDNPNAKLGFTIIDPLGAEIGSSLTMEEIITGEVENTKTKASVNVETLGECREGEYYSICVFSLDDIKQPIDFTIEYSWYQNYTKNEGDGLASASNGAILASTLNAPLLYTSPDSISKTTIDALLMLGVENIYLVNLGGYLSDDVKEELKTVGDITEDFKEPKQVYDAIRENTEQNDVIFTTMEPWEYWYAEELKPCDDSEYQGALFVGPAAYIAAHHGSPLLIVDTHPELSQSVVYHKNFWRYNAEPRNEPSYGDMVITGRAVYSFLDEYGFDEQEKMETIITVAGQYNIGPSWDRTFVGKAIPGRFQFSPVDTSYWICRNEFYPSLIFANPGIYEEEAMRINGSTSNIQKIGGRLKDPKGVTLVVNKKNAGEQEYRFPVLQSYCSIAYKFNEEASKYWGTMYTRADGITPYVTPSPDPIDVGSVPSKPNAAYYPDLDDSNVVPFYATKAGYDNVFSSTFESVVENLNRGVIMFMQDSHGAHLNSGIVSFWDPENPYIYEENPWRAYEPIMFKAGHLRTFLHLLPYLLSYGEEGLLKTISQTRLIKFQLFSEVGCTENPDVAVLNPDLGEINKIYKKFTGGMLDLLGAFGTRIHWDRIFSNPNNLPIITHSDGMVTISPNSGSVVALTAVNGYEFDDALENVHSTGINTVACLPAGTYLQMAWIRHGTVYTIMDPWSTSDYCAVWLQSIVKNLAMGDTIGQAYEKGIRACGPELLNGNWWWDVWENVCFYGDPNLRIFVPSTEWDPEESNTWEKPDSLSYDEELNIQGHMPFGATSHPHEKEPQTFVQKNLFIIVILVIIILLFIALAVVGRKKRK